MKKAVVGVLALVAGLSLAQQVDYREAARAAAALARLQTVAEKASGEEKLLQWAQEVKARAERSYEAQDHFKALREAQAALLLYRAAQGAPKEKEGMGGEVRRDRPARRDRAEVGAELVLREGHALWMNGTASSRLLVVSMSH